MKKRRLMKAAVLAMLLAMTGSGIYAAGTGNQPLTTDSSVSDAFDYQIAAGNLASTAGDYATAYGYLNYASGNYSTAFGSGTTSEAGNYQNSALGLYSTAIGFANTATVGRSTAVGYRNEAIIDYGTAIGVLNLAKGMYGTAVGYGSSTTGDYSTAVGNRASASGLYSTSIGVGDSGTTNSASGQYSSAFGFKNTAGAEYAQAFGSANSASALAEGAIVMGSANTVDGENANAFGYKNQAGSDQTMSIGSQNLTTGVAATTIGFSNITNQDYAMAIGVSNTAAGQYSMAMGQNNASSGAYAFAEGAQNISGIRSAVTQRGTTYTTAIGYGNTATGDITGTGSGQTVSLGISNTVTVNNSVALGAQNSIQSGTQSVAFGFNNILNGDGIGIAAAFGGNNTVDSDSLANPAAAFGYGNTTDGIAVGYGNTGEKNQAKDKGGAYVYPVAIGSENKDNGIGSFNTGNGIGYQNTVNHDYATANGIGTQNTATKAAAIAVGYMNEAGGDATKEGEGRNSDAIGVLNVASGTNSGAFGYRNYAGAENSIAMGAGNNMTSYDTAKYTSATTGTGSVAVGYQNNAQSANSTVFGYQNIAYSGSVEGGSKTATDGSDAAFGAKNKVYGNDSVALGYGNTSGKIIPTSSIGGSTATTYHSVAVGNANTATGYISSGSTSDTRGNTVAVGYSNTADGNYAKAFGVSNVVHANESSAFGYNNKIYNYGYSTDSSNYNGYQASALGVSNMVGYPTSSYSYQRGQQSTAVGVSNEVYSKLSIAAGYSNTPGNGSYNSLFGVSNNTWFEYSSSYTNNNNTLVGFGNSVPSYSSSHYDGHSLFGLWNKASGDDGSALGKSNVVSSSTITLGVSNSASSSYGSALGYTNTAGYYGIALGWTNTSYSYGGTIGYSNTASGYSDGRISRAYAIGGGNTADTGRNSSNYYANSMVVGYENYLYTYSYTSTPNQGSVKVGVGNKSTSDTSYSAIIGINNSNASTIYYLTQIGSGNKAYGGSYYDETYGMYSTWMGQDNTYSYNGGYNHRRTSVIGKDNQLGYYSRYSTAIGFSNRLNYLEYNTAIGTSNKVGGRYNSNDGNNYQATAVGSGNDVSGMETSAFGSQNQIYYSKISSSPYDKYNGGTGSSLIGIRNNLEQSDYYSAYYYGLGIDNDITIKYSTALGAENIVGGTSPSYNYYGTDTSYNIAIGVGNEAGGTYVGLTSGNSSYNSNTYRSYYITAVGLENKVTGYANTAIGYQNAVSGNGTMTQGAYNVHSSAAVGQSNTVKAAMAMTQSYTASYNAGGYGSYVLGHDNVTQAPYSVVIGGDNTVGGTRAYNNGASSNSHLDNTAIGTGNVVGTSSYQDKYYPSGYGETYKAFNTYSGTGIGFRNEVGSNYVTAAGYHNTIVNADKNTSETNLGIYTVTYSAALGQENTIRAFGDTLTTSKGSDSDLRVSGGEYSYAIGYGNTTQFAGSTALGFSNTVGASEAARSVLASSNGYYNANTAIGTGNTVGGLFVTDKDGKKYQVSFATAIGVTNTAGGESSTTVGVSNTITDTRTGHQNKEEKNRSAALGSRNTITATLDTIGTADAVYGDVYNYAIGTDNAVTGAGNLAVGRENVVGGSSAKQETADAANTAVGANNVVGGTYVHDEYGEENGRYNLASGFGNYAIGQENTAIGISNTIAENVGTLQDSKNLTQHNVLLGISNTVNDATYTGPRMYNIGIGEGNTFRNGYDTAIGFYNTVGGELASNVDDEEKMYHVAVGSQNTLAGTDGTANGMRMTAVGSGNTTYGRDSVAIGKSSVTGTEDMENDTRESAAVGVRATAASMKSLAVGVDVTANTVTGAVAVGQNSTVSGEKSSSFGVNNTVTGTESLALGTDNQDVFGDRTIVVGSGNTSAVTQDDVQTGTNNSVIFGVDSTVTGDQGIVFGGEDTAAGGAIAAGYESEALGEHSFAMGYAQTVTATGKHGVAVGSGYERTYTTTTAGVEEEKTDYFGTTVSGESGAAFGVANLVSGNYATAAGAGYYRHTDGGTDYFFQNTASGDYSSAFGYLNVAEGEHSLAAGTGYVETVDDTDTLYANIAKRAKSAALGYANQAWGEESLAAGGESRTGSKDSDTAGKGATAVGEGYMVTVTENGGTRTERRYNEATGAGATALGFANTATGAASMAAGSLSKASAANATALGVGILKETKDGDVITDVEYIENAAEGDGSTAVGYANHAESEASTALGSLSEAIGTGATAVGTGYTKEDGTLVYNEANGTGAVAFGYANAAQGANATALGSTITVEGTEWVNEAVSEGSTAIGAGNTAGATDKEKATAIGVINTATGAKAVAIGVENEALADYAIFLGNENKATATSAYAAAIGTSNTLGGKYTLALGTSNEAKTNYAIALGAEAETGTTGGYQIATGYQAKATGDKAIAIGYGAQASEANAVAFGTNAKAGYANSVAIGTNSVATDSRRQLEVDLEGAGTRTTHTVSFGESTTRDNVTTGIVSRLTNVAEGRETEDTSGNLTYGTDAINVKQLKRYIDTVAVDYQHRVKNTEEGTLFTTEGSYITEDGRHWLSTDFGNDSVEHGNDSTAYGYLANATGVTSAALGYNAKAQGTDSIAMAGATATGEAGIAVGSGASAETGAALGTGATATGASYAIGAGATSSGTNQMALGAGSVTTGDEYTISVGSEEDASKNHRIVNLADAQIDKTKGDYDETAAVNVETMKKILDTMPEDEAIVIYDDDTDGSDWHTSNNHWVATDFDLNPNGTVFAHGKDSAGYGYATRASGTNATAVGHGKSIDAMTEATADYASAFGMLDTASGAYSLAAGVQNTANSAYATAVGYKSDAILEKSTALGYSASAGSVDATAIGNSVSAAGEGSLAVGTAYSDGSLTSTTTVDGQGATAVGAGVKASGDKALALGAVNTVSGENAMGVGASNSVNGAGSGAFGTENIIGGSMDDAAKSYAFGFQNVVTGEQATAMGYENSVSAAYGTAMGYSSLVSGERGVAAGKDAEAAAADAAAAGSLAVAAGASSTAVGYKAYATVANSTAIGYEATAVDSKVADDGTADINTVSFGHGKNDIDPTTSAAYNTEITSRLTHIAAGVSDTDAANVSQLKESVIVDFDETYETSEDHRLSTDFGYEDILTHGKNSTAYGYLANATGENAVALGYGAYASAGVALGAESVATSDVVSVGHKKDDKYTYIDDNGAVQEGTYDDVLTRRITNVAKGTDDYDLVNVAQLKEETKTAGIVKWDGVEGTDAKHWLATYFGNADYYTPGENSSAYGYLTKATGAGSTALGYAAWALSDNAVALGSQSVASSNVVSVGHAAKDKDTSGNDYGSELTRKIIHVADGTADTDLVNVRTLKTTDPVKSGTDGTNRWVVTSDTATVSYTPGTNATAYGLSSQALGAESTAIGYGAVVKANAGTGSVAIGANSVAERVTDANGNAVSVVSVGGKKTETQEGDIEIETRRITNVADGITDTTASNYTGTDLVTYQQLKLATAEGGIVDYDINYKDPTGGHWLSTNFGETGANAENSTSFGYASKVSAERGAALGYNASVTVADGVAIGTDSVASVAGTVSVGHTKEDINPLTNETYKDNLTRTITGVDFGVDGTDAVSVAQLQYTDPVKTGTTAGVTGENHYLTTLDPTTYTPGENSVAYGLGTGQAKGAYASGKQAVAFGLNAFAPAENAVALGAGSFAGEENTISLGHTTKQIDRATSNFYADDLNRKITGVADAIWDLNAENYNSGTDLVNVKVLREHTENAIGVVLTTGDDHNLYTELNDIDKVTPASQAVAYGKQAYANAADSVALGYKSYTGIKGGIALGTESVASEEGTVSVGHKDGDTYYDYDDQGNYVQKTYDGQLLRRVTGLDFGTADSDAVSVAQLKLTDPVKTGTTDGVTGENHWFATPMGGAAYARGEDSVAYGYGTAATVKNTVAFGYAALAQQENAVAIGSDSVAKDANTVSVGHKQGDTKEDRSAYEDNLERRIIHVAAGEADTDLINVSQLHAAVDLITVIDWDKDRTANGQKWLSTDFGYKDKFTHGLYSTAYGHFANAAGTQSAAVGYGSYAADEGGMALGAESVAKGNTISVGHAAGDTYQYIDDNGQAATGTYAEALTRRITNVQAGKADTDMVNVAQLKSTDPIKTGTTEGVTDENHWLATDMGGGIIGTPGTNSAAYGFETKASGENAVAFGYRAVATGSGSVALGAFSAAADDNVVSVGHQATDLNYKGQKFMDTLTRRIVNVKAGREDIDASTGKYVYGTDIVTVAQLNRAAATSGGVVEFAGDYETGDNHYLSTYISTGGGATNNATSAAYGFKANVAADATNGAALGYNATVSAANATAIGAGSVANIENTISVGDAANGLFRRITNVADGITDVSADNYNNATDALTVGQLHQYYLPKSGTDADGNTWVATTYGSPIDPGQNSAAYGTDAAATGARSTAFGYGATASDDDSVVIGAGAVSAGANTVSVGDGTSEGNRRITNVAAGRDDVDGDGKYIHGNDAVNYGQLKEILKVKGVGIVKYDTEYANMGDHRLTTVFEDEEEEGTGKTSAKDAVAFGYQADASYEKSVAFGAGATAGYASSAALGAGSVVYEKNTVSVGDNKNGLTRRITNVKAGTADTDMINVSQLNEVKNVLAINGVKDGSTTLVQELKTFTDGVADLEEDIGTFSGDVKDTNKTLTDKNGITKDSNIFGRLKEAEGKIDGFVSGDTVKEGDNTSIVGYGNTTKGDEASAYGYKNEATGDKSTATGSKNIASGDNASAYGSNNVAGDARDPTKTGQTAMGSDNIVTGQDATGIGTANTVTGEHATGNGYQNSVSGQDAIGTGSQNHVEGTHSAAYGFDNHVTGDGSLAYGSGNEARGDGAVAIGNNAWATGDGGVAMGTGSRAVENSVAIGAGAVATEKGTVSFGNADEKTTSRLVNLADGQADSDVATYGQIKGLEDKTSDFDKRINDLTYDSKYDKYNSQFNTLDSLIDQADKNISKVGAGAAAMAALHPLEFDPSEKVSFALGYGNYRGENAMAVGAFVRPNDTITLSLGGSMGNGDNLVNSSISFALGSGPSGLAARSKAALAKQVNEQDEKIAARDAEIAQLRSLISQLEAMAETEEQKTVAHEMVIRSETAELEELRSMAQQLVATASADQLRSIVSQLSANPAT